MDTFKRTLIRALRLGLYTFLASITAAGLDNIDRSVIEHATIAGLAAILSVVEDLLRPTE